MANNNLLFNDPLIQSAEESRVIIVRRNKALEPLSLSEAETDRLESELRTIGWPEWLASIFLPQPVEAKMVRWPVPEERALLCVNRHAKAGSKVGHEQPDFFGHRRLDCQLSRALNKQVDGWDHDNTENLVKLYRGGKSFGAIAAPAGDFPQFTVRKLKIVYGKCDRDQKTEKRKSINKSNKSTRHNAKTSEVGDEGEDEDVNSDEEQ